MANTILLKRNSTANAAPGTSDLALGEVAINTNDGRLYTKIDNGSASIVDLTKVDITGDATGNRVGSTGDITLTLANSGVAANTYGSATTVPQITVDAKGRITSASSVTIDNDGIANGTSNVSVPVADGNVTISVGGTDDVLVVTTDGANVAGNADVTGNITVNAILTDGYFYANGAAFDVQQPSGANTQIQYNDGAGGFGASANFTFNEGTNTLAVSGDIDATTGTIATLDGTSADFSGNVDGGNINSDARVVATGNVSGANFITGGLVDATGNVSGANFITAGDIDAATGTITTLDGTSADFSGNVDGGNINSDAQVVATGNITGANFITAGDIDAGTGTIVTLDGTTADFSGNIDGGNINSDAQVVATGNVTGGNINTAGIVSATGNVVGGNVTTAGVVDATGNVSGGNLTTGGAVVATGDVSGATITSTAFQGASPTISSTDTNGDITLDPNGTGVVDVSSARITSVATPSGDNDAANKAYVDSVAEGLDIKESVVAATTAALSNAYTYDNGSSGVGATITFNANGAMQTVDGVTLTSNERVLIKDESGGNAPYNGIYVLTTVGDGSTQAVLTRAGDFDGDPGAEIPGGFTFVEEGTVNQDAGFVCTTNSPVTVGSTDIEFTQFSGAGAIQAGDGLSKTGNTLDVNVDDSTLEISADTLRIKASAPLTTPDIGEATGTSLDVTGNVDAGNLITTGLASVTGNITGGNLITGGAVEATGDITGANFITSGDIDAGTGTIVTLDGTTADFSGNIDGGNLNSDAAIVAAGLISAGTTITATGNISGGNIDGTRGAFTNIAGTIETAAQPNITSLGNLTVANIGTATISTLANVTATTAATSTTSGALKVAGGVGIVGDLYAADIYKNGTVVLNADDNIDGGTY